MRRPSAAGLIVGFLMACSQSSIPRPTAAPSDDSSVVIDLELARAGAGESLMAALQRTRPLFLSARGGTVIVSIDGQVFADTSILRTIRATDVCAVRLQRATSGAGQSAILPGGRVSSGGNLIAVLLRHEATTGCTRQ